ncbi:MAG: hypothetical protein ACYTHK_06020 [Planctomycetota bacterium]
MQVVGQPCALCRQRISSILDGRFCPSCGSPVHNACAISGGAGVERCAVCGVALHLAAEYRQRAREEEGEQVAAIRQHHLFWGIGSILVGLLLLGLGVATVLDSIAAVDEGRSSILWWGAILVGLGMLVKGGALILAAMVARRR